MKSNGFRFFTAVVVALLAWCAPQRSAIAAKPPAAPPPAGKIHYVADGFIYSMNSDGSSKQQISPALSNWPTLAPISSKTYSASRWTLLIEQTNDVFYAYHPDTGAVTSFYGTEVFAYRWINNAWQVVRVTDLTKDGMRPLSDSTADVTLTWSNDGQDAFLSVRLTSFELTPEGWYIVDYNNYPQSIARIHLTGSELDQLALSGADAMIDGADPRFEVVATEPATSSSKGHIFTAHSWSPDGTKLSIYEEVGLQRSRHESLRLGSRRRHQDSVLHHGLPQQQEPPLVAGWFQDRDGMH